MADDSIKVELVVISPIFGEGSSTMFQGLSNWVKRSTLTAIFVLTAALIVKPTLTNAKGEPKVLDRHGSKYWTLPNGRQGKRSYPHTGTDYSVPIGTVVLAPADGLVKFARHQSDLSEEIVNLYEDGNCIIIRHRNNIRTFYAHMSRIYVSEGQAVERGDVIGEVGQSGYWINRNNYPHLHFQTFRSRLGDHFDPYPSYWFGGKGVPTAYKEGADYSAADSSNGGPLFTHPIAFGSVLSEAKKQAKVLRTKFYGGDFVRRPPFRGSGNGLKSQLSKAKSGVVSKWQKYFVVHGFYQGAIDGQYGPGTENAVTSCVTDTNCWLGRSGE